MSNRDIPVYEIYAIRYSHDPHRRFAENFLPTVAESIDHHLSAMPMDFYCWVLRGGGRIILVDTGFDHAEADRRRRQLLFPVGEALAALDIEPRTISDVIVTHLHWDHAGNHDLCPDATYHVQDREIDFCTGRCMCDLALRRPFTVGDVTAMIERIHAGRVVFHDGDEEILPGVTVHLVGGHTPGLQVVRVNTARGSVVLASDASHYYANVEQSRAFPLVIDLPKMLDGFRILRALASSPDHIVPGHDPLVLQRYPRSSAHLADIVRLDLPPCG